MSVSTTSTDVTEVPGVNHAVRRLQELAKRMKSVTFGFREKDVANIDKVIDALHDLEEERRRLHEQLEVETIESSILRHRLAVLPNQIKEEISSAVNAARGSNEAELTRLQSELSKINQDTEFLETRYKQLEKENAVLHPERDKVREQHEEIVMQLNQRLAEKAGKQIVLNETRDKLRETNLKILDIEETVTNLKEDLIQERADAKKEKKRLKKAVYDTVSKTREQKEANLAKKKEVDGLYEQVINSELELSSVRKNINTYEISIAKMVAEEQQLDKDLTSRLRENQQLRKHGEEVVAETNEEKSAFDEKKTALQAKIRQLEEEIQEAQNRNVELTTGKDNLNREYNLKTMIREDDDAQVKTENTRLQEMKVDLAKKAEEVGRLTQENTDFERLREELAETHKSIVATKTKQIAEAQSKLTEERNETTSLQTKTDSQQEVIDKFLEESQRLLRELNKQINDGITQRDALLKEDESLRKSIMTDNDKIKKLKAELAKSNKDYEKQQEVAAQEILQLQDNIKKLEEEVKERQEAIKALHPDHDALEQQFQDLETKNDTTKKAIVAKNREKQSIEDSVKRTKKEIEQMVKPLSDVKENLKQRRADTIDLLKKQGENVKDVEGKIYNIKVKLKRFLEENDLLQDAIEGYQQEIDGLNSKTEYIGNTEQKLEKFIETLKAFINEDWEEDVRLGVEMAGRDQLLVNQLSDLLRMTERREEVVTHVADRLQSELTLLAQFLDKVASRRPKESRQESRGRARKPETPLPPPMSPFKSGQPPLPPIPPSPKT